MKNTSEYSSRFRILKGGKISLVVSALVLSAGLVTSANATQLQIGDSSFQIQNNTVVELAYNNNAVTIDTTNYSADILGTGPVSYTIDGVSISGTSAKTINFGSNFDITNADSIMQFSNLSNTTVNNYGTLVTTAYWPTIEATGTNSSFHNYGTIENSYDSFVSRALNIDGMNFFNEVGGKIIGNIKILNGNLTNAGTISLPYYANGSDYPSYKPTISGTFTNNGTLEIGVKNVNGALSYSKLETGHAIFGNGSKIYVNVLDPQNTNGLLIGGTTVLRDVVTATGLYGITDSGLVVEDNSALVNFEKDVHDATTQQAPASIDLKVVQAKTITDSVTNGGGNKNSIRIAQNLELIKLYDQILTLISSLNQLPTDGAVNQATQTLGSETVYASRQSTIHMLTMYANIVGNYLSRQFQNYGANSGDTMKFDDKNLWVKPFGSLGKQNDKDGQSGFSTNSYGLGVGMDGEYKKDQKVGLAMFYSRANVDVNNVDQKSDMDVMSAILYGSNLLRDNATTFSYQLGYSWQKTASDRKIFTGESASAEYTSTTASVDLKLAHQFNLGKAFSIEPNIGTTYRYNNNPTYSETGAGSANLIVDKFSTTEFLGNVGTAVTYNFNNNSSVVANLGAGYNFRDTTNNVSSAFEGASAVKFASQSIDNGRWRYNAGLGYDAHINEVSSINVSYDFQAQGRDFTNNVLSAKYEYKF